MDDNKAFKARVWEKFMEEMGKFFGTRLAFLIVFFYSIMVGLARYYILGRNSAMNFFLDLFIDSLLVGVPYLILLCIITILRAPYLAGKELQEKLEQFEPSK